MYVCMYVSVIGDLSSRATGTIVLCSFAKASRASQQMMEEADRIAVRKIFKSLAQLHTSAS